MMRSRLHILFLVAAMLFASFAAGNTVNSISLPTYAAPGYVISADAVDGIPGTNRHLIDTRCQVTINTAGNYVIEWNLLAPDNSVMCTSTSSFPPVTVVPVTFSVDGTLTPATTLPLEVGVLYRLRARLINTGTSAVESTMIHCRALTFISKAPCRGPTLSMLFPKLPTL